MSSIDWLVIVLLLSGIILYGLYKSRTTKNLDGYFLSNNNMPWWLILLSIMGTQASAITFLSGPGQAYTDGMRFVQYYFGIPLAMVVICITFVPIFNKLKVYTAYEFLEKRFDAKTRTFTSFLFLLQRGLSTGVSIYAPSIILCSLFGWDIFWTNIVMGGLLIIYTVSGGARAVAYTQTLQVIIIFIAMILAGYVIVQLLPPHVGFIDALHVGGKSGKLNVITSGRTATGFNWNDRYNIWSGLIGGFFLALSYFGTDQSQVGRYLTAKNNRASKLGLLLNGLIKVPMQFFILLIGVLVFSFYQFNPAPISFNDALAAKANNSRYKDSLKSIEEEYKKSGAINKARQNDLFAFQKAGNTFQVAALNDSLLEGRHSADSIKSHYQDVLKKALPGEDVNDTNYVFLSFVKHYLPTGLKGLLIAIIFLAAWGSIAAALNSLAASTVVDFHCRIVRKDKPINQYRISKWYTLGWGLFSILIAQFSSKLGQSLIEAVNVLGSLFYGVILGIFLVAFYLKKIKGNAIFVAAVIVEIFIVILFFNERIPGMHWLPDISFLWLNAIGALGVMAVASLLQGILGTDEQGTRKEE